MVIKSFKVIENDVKVKNYKYKYMQKYKYKNRLGQEIALKNGRKLELLQLKVNSKKVDHLQLKFD